MRARYSWLLTCLSVVGLALAAPRPAAGDFIDFEDLVLTPNSFYNGSDGAGGFTSRGAFFNNSYSPTFDAWSGWSYSNVNNVTRPGLPNQYAAYHQPGTTLPVRGDGSPNYGVAFSFSPGEAFINLPTGTTPVSARITNTTYTALSMLRGDAFSRRFGGLDGTDPDFLLLTISGFDSSGALTGTVDFYLADYRFDDSALDYIIDQWTTVDLTSLGAATRLSFGFASSDVGPFGINTPTYFALDNLEVRGATSAVPAPGALCLAGIGGALLLAAGLRRRLSGGDGTA